MKSLDDMTEPELNDVMLAAARAVKLSLPDGTGFILLACPFTGRAAQYIGNCKRESAKSWMEQVLLRWERHEDIPR